MSVVVEPQTVDREPSARVVALRPAVGRHTAAGPSPEVVALVGPAPRLVDDDLHLGRHSGTGEAEGDADGAPLVRELEAVVGRARSAGGMRSALRGELAALLGAWAAALVRLHRTSVTPATPVADVPWVLDGPLPGWLAHLPADIGPVWAARAHPGIARALAATRSGWTSVQWTHGDPTGDEVVVTRRHGVLRATLLGAACGVAGCEEHGLTGQPHSGSGDPRWDVATALDWLAIGLGPVLDPTWQVNPVSLFLTEYRALGGNAVPDRPMAIARTVATAVEWTAQLAVAAEADDSERAWLTGLWSRPLDLVTGYRRFPGVRVS